MDRRGNVTAEAAVTLRSVGFEECVKFFEPMFRGVNVHRLLADR